jgi:hypothetical protein
MILGCKRCQNVAAGLIGRRLRNASHCYRFMRLPRHRRFDCRYGYRRICRVRAVRHRIVTRTSACGQESADGRGAFQFVDYFAFFLSTLNFIRRMVRLILGPHAPLFLVDIEPRRKSFHLQQPFVIVFQVSSSHEPLSEFLFPFGHGTFLDESGSPRNAIFDGMMLSRTLLFLGIRCHSCWLYPTTPSFVFLPDTHLDGNFSGQNCPAGETTRYLHSLTLSDRSAP